MNYISTKTRKFAVMALAALSLLALIGYPPAWAQEKPNVTVCGTCKQDPCTKCNACGTHSQSGKTHTKAACGSHNKCDNGSHDKKHPCNTHYKCDTAPYPDGHGACKVSGCSEGGYLCSGDHATAGCNVKGHTNCDGKNHTQCTESGCELLLCDGHKHCKAVGCYATPPHDPCQNPNCGKYECECNCHKCSDCDSYDVTECPHSCGNGMGSVSGDKVYHCDTHMCKCTYDQSGDDCSYDGQTSFTYKADTYGASFDVSSLIKVKTGTSAKCQCGKSDPNGKHTIKFSPKTVDMTSAASQKADKVYSIKVSCEDCSFTKTVKITNKHVCAFGHSACTYVKLSGGKSSFIHHPDGTEEEVVANVAIKSPINLSAEVYECCQYCHKKGQTLSGTWVGVNGSKIQFNKVGTDKQVLYVDSNNRNNAFGGLKFNVYCDAHEPGSVTVTPHDAVLCDTVPDGNGWMAQGSFNAKLEKCAKCGKDEFNSFSTKWTISGATPSKTSGQGLSTGTINFRGFDSGSVKFTAKATGSSSSSVEVSGEEHFKVEHTHNWVGATNQSWSLTKHGSITVTPRSSSPIFIKVGEAWNKSPKEYFKVTTTRADIQRLDKSCSKCNRKKYKTRKCHYLPSYNWKNMPLPKTYNKGEAGEKDFTAELKGDAVIDGVVLGSVSKTATKKAYVWNVNLQVDSNNDGTISVADDTIESDPQEYGAITFCSRGDQDKDQIPDYADDKVDGAEIFSEVKFLLDTLGSSFSSKTTFTFSEAPWVTQIDNKYTLPTSGDIRIWTKKSSQKRDPLKDLVKTGKGYTYPELKALFGASFTPSSPVTLYLEAVNGSYGQIRVKTEELSSNQSITDSVKITTVSVNVTHMAFNHDRTKHDADAMNMRQSVLLPEIENAEWIDVDSNIQPETCKGVLYKKGVKPTVYARLLTKPVGFVNSVTIEAEGLRLPLSGTGDLEVLSLGGFKPESIGINYADGVSTGTKIIDKVSGYDDFSTVNSTASKILREEAYLNWKVSSIDYNSFSGVKTYAPTLLPKVCTGVVAGKAPYAKASSNWRVPKELVIYTIWDEPIKPWSTADTLLAADNPLGTGDLDDNPHQPWQKAMDFSMAPAFANANDKNDTEFLKSLTSHLHSGHGLKYETEGGRYKYFEYDTVKDIYMINLNSYIDISNTNTVNCYDQAVSLSTLGNLHGVETEVLFLKPYGYIPVCKLVGNIETHNPFHDIYKGKTSYAFRDHSSSLGYHWVYYKTDKKIKKTDGSVNDDYCKEDLKRTEKNTCKFTGRTYTLPVYNDRTSFGNHAFVRSQKDQKIFDSCAGPALGTDSVDKYYQDYHDDSTSLEDEKDTDSLSSSLETWTIKVIK